MANILAFALKIQAAGVNRRLKHDMADQVPTLTAEVLKGISLFEPEVSDAGIPRVRAICRSQMAVEGVCDRTGDRPAKRRRRLRPAITVGSRPGRMRA